MALSRKDFEMIAKNIRFVRNWDECANSLEIDDYIAINEALDHLVDRLAIDFKESNSRFDYEKFNLACRM